MDKKDNEFLKRIRETFRIEAEEHIKAFSAGLIDLEKTQNREKLSDIIEIMFREIHSLKGAARSVDQKEVESLCLPLESVFSALKRTEITLLPNSIDLFYKTAELLSKLSSESSLVLTTSERQLQKELIRDLKDILTGTLTTRQVNVQLQNKETKQAESLQISSPENEKGSENYKSTKTVSMESVRIRMSKLDPLLLQAEELIQTNMAIKQSINELKEIHHQVAGWNEESLKWRVTKSSTSSTLLNEWFQVEQDRLHILASQLEELARSIGQNQYNLDLQINNHLGAMKQVLMLPVSSLVETFPGMVREISRELNKEIEFVIRGAELEIDKRILEELKDPLIHLIRNSIDHGIGKPQERILKHKPGKGTIILAFTARESNMVEISLSDDGKGIDKEQVLKAAIKTGILSGEASEKLDTEEILPLIYQSGVSTSSIITDISGRGLGLSIVREKVEKLNGRISLETEPDRGTSFHILLPMTLATFRGILIKIKECMFIIPTVNVERVLKVNAEDIKTVENRDTICIDNQILSVAELGDVLGLSDHSHADSSKMEQGSLNSDYILLVLLVSGENHIAFKVDEVVDEEQVLVKGLGKLVSRVRNISGATVLGSGKVVPVLHISDLMKSALKPVEKSKKQISFEKTTEKIQKILIAEDSITSRTLLKNILETAGYQVTTAVDGSDAYFRARSDEFDLIVSDVDMPRMNGFELTAKIRNDKKLCDIPVILVTSLESRDDRERGIEVGANAYIIKSNFDQANLLEVIKKLI
jgi:two-component system, chemotaxis family, sensor kinase CheA